MNTKHYPSLELCKQLTDIGFPETEQKEYSFGYVCPSVMEMLDVMPDDINTGSQWLFSLSIERCSVSYVAYGNDYGAIENGDTTADAMAQMILWLHENNHISFTK